MSLFASRMMLRSSQAGRVGMRYASSTSEAANAASQTASKASQGLSQVSSSASSNLSKYAGAAGNALNNVGGRTGKLIGFVQSLIPPTMYYGRVGLELAKLVAQGQKMSPPNMQTFQTYGQNLMNAVRNPSANTPSNPFQTLKQVRNMSSAQMATIGVVTAELLGFFTVGQMIGRMKLVGYRSTASNEHH